MTHEVKLTRLSGTAFRRAATHFPTTPVSVETAEQALKADAFCVVSFDPAVIALTVPLGAAAGPGPEFIVSATAIKLHCTLMKTSEIGDHVMVFANVRRVEIGIGVPSINWRGASFQLRLDYPFLENAGTLDAFVSHWRAGALPKSAWTHAAHVAVTGYYAFASNAEAVFTEMKRGILLFNAAVGVVNGPDSGYHETLTRFWSNMITRAISKNKLQSRLDAAVCAVRLFGEDRDLPFLFYSFDVVRNRRARREWVLPDQEPLTEWCGV